MRKPPQVLAAILLAAVFAAPVSAVTPGGAAQETLTGIIETAQVELGDGRDHVETTLRTGTTITPVAFDTGSARDLSGSRVTLTGLRHGGVLHVGSAVPGASGLRIRTRAAPATAGAWATETSGSARASGGTTTATVEATTVTRSVAVVMFNFTDVRATPYTKAQALDALINSPTSARRFFEEESKGQLTMTGSAFGWYPLAVASTGCDWSGWHTLAWNAANAAGANLESFSNVIFVFPNTTSCGWAGLGYVPGRYTYLNGTIDVQVMTHELGHNLGLAHSNADACVVGGTRVMIAAPASCTEVGYADPFSTMGNNALRHNHGSHLGELGWLAASDKVVGVPGNSYTVMPYFGGSGLKLVRIPRGDGSFFDLDVRTPYGSFDTFAVGSPVTLGVTVRIGQGTASPTTSPKATLLLDSTPATATLQDAPLVVGRTMTDPVSGISITTMSAGGGGVVVRVRESTLPTAPGSLSGSAGSGSVVLAWTGATDNVAIGGYRVSRNGVTLTTTAPSAATWTDTTVTAGASYTYGVSAVDTSGNVGPAVTRAVTIPGANPTPAPTATTTPRPSTTPSPTPRPSATANPSPTPKPSATPTPRPSPTATPKPSPTAAPGPTQPPVRDAKAPTAPARVTGVPTITTVALYWTAATDDTGVVAYRVSRDGVLVASPRSLTWKDTARRPNTSYTYAVAALDGVGNVSSRTTFTVRTLRDTIRPTTPRRFRKVARSGAYVTFDWSPSTDNVHVVKYAIYRVGRSAPVASTKVSKIRMYTVRGARYYVRAIDSTGNRSFISARARGR